MDVRLGDAAPGPLDLGLECGRGFRLGAIRRQEHGRQDELGGQVERDMALVAVDPLRLALAAMPEVGIPDRSASLGGYALPDARLAPARWVGLEILRADLGERLDVLLERRLLHLPGGLLPPPRPRLFDRARQRIERLGLRIRIAPLAVDPLLHARLQERWDARR